MNILTAFIIFALLLTVATLVWGIGSMVHGGAYDRKHSVHFMGARVSVQGLALALVLLALLLASLH